MPDPRAGRGDTGDGPCRATHADRRAGAAAPVPPGRRARFVRGLPGRRAPALDRGAGALPPLARRGVRGGHRPPHLGERWSPVRRRTPQRRAADGCHGAAGPPGRGRRHRVLDRRRSPRRGPHRRGAPGAQRLGARRPGCPPGRTDRRRREHRIAAGRRERGVPRRGHPATAFGPPGAPRGRRRLLAARDRSASAGGPAVLTRVRPAGQGVGWQAGRRLRWPSNPSEASRTSMPPADMVPGHRDARASVVAQASRLRAGGSAEASEAVAATTATAQARLSPAATTGRGVDRRMDMIAPPGGGKPASPAGRRRCLEEIRWWRRDTPTAHGGREPGSGAAHRGGACCSGDAVVGRCSDVIVPTLREVQIPFRPSERASLGVEWELLLVDLESRELSAGAVEILEEIRPDGADEHPKAKHELLQSTIEIITGICTTVAEAKADLAGTLSEVSAAAAHRGLGLMCAGTHPFTDWQTQLISPKERYLQLVERMQWLARRMQIFGVHVHVGVRAPEKAIPIVNALTLYVPHFLALSASSPYWQGADTGLASARSKVFEGLPTAGLPYQLSGWDEFESYMETLISTHAIESVREVWWDIRPHPGFGTVELRICDGLPTLDEIGAVVALSQCVVKQFDAQLDRGYTLPRPISWIIRENKWRAARYGLDADIVVDEKGTVRPVRQAILDLVDDLSPTAKRLGCEAELRDVERVLAVGASYQRQRAIAAASDGDLRLVVDSLLGEMRDGLAGRT